MEKDSNIITIKQIEKINSEFPNDGHTVIIDGIGHNYPDLELVAGKKALIVSEDTDGQVELLFDESINPNRDRSFGGHINRSNAKVLSQYYHKALIATKLSTKDN